MMILTVLYLINRNKSFLYNSSLHNTKQQATGIGKLCQNKSKFPAQVCPVTVISSENVGL